MIEKMKFLTITGPKDDIDRVMNEYLSKYEIHLENALAELSSVHDLKPFVEINPYKDSLTKSETLISKLDKELKASTGDISLEEADNIIKKSYALVEELSASKKQLQVKKEAIDKKLKLIEPFRMLDYDLQKILDFKFVKFRFGKISHEYYTKFSNYVYDNLSTVFIECDRDEHYVWGVYFVPASAAVKVDAVFSSLHFERIFIPSDYKGTPEVIYQTLINELKQIRQEKHDLNNQMKEKLRQNGEQLLLATKVLQEYSDNYDIRKLAACTKGTKQGLVFYILCGWMSVRDSKRFMKEIEQDPNVYCIAEDVHEAVDSKPPTKLKNPKLFKPFEMFIEMYGLPAYNEIDPTIFVAITYTLIFGIMFGDVGQGACLCIGGLLLYRFKKMNSAAIIRIAGIW